jgi:hypothetical protein
MKSTQLTPQRFKENLDKSTERLKEHLSKSMTIRMLAKQRKIRKKTVSSKLI